MPYVVGIVGLLALWLIIGFGASFNIGKMIGGEDGRPSTSKLQVLLWTAVVVFSYLAIYVIRIDAKHYDQMPPIPKNVLIAMGISVSTAVAAKSIAVKSIAAGNAKPEDVRKGGILEDDNGKPDIAKMQLVIWTFIAIGVYLYNVNQSIILTKEQLPDIDATLMILMRLGHAGYVGTKVASS